MLLPCHKNKFKRTGTGQAWFPESWTEIDIKNAGEYVANIPENINVPDGTWVFGEYNGVRVGTIKNNGKIGTIIPDNSRQPQNVCKENDMIDNSQIEKIIEERKKMHPDDPRVVEKWNELTQIFIQNEESTIAYLNSCCKENIDWISEVFEDISEQLQSFNFIECIEQLAIKYPDLDLEKDILYAKAVLK